uniref:2-methoxy-6-polyprenyl-1,4-benzoquinol methylase n=1 Tax=Guillardia theta TaxID=55529 RepID=A0A7S4JJK8_GUITH
MFDAIAPRYDVINTALSLGMHSLWRRKMVSSLELKPGFKVLDLGTGTADVALAIAKELAKQGGSKNIGKEAVIGLDPSQNMLSHGRKKVHKAGFSDKAVKLIHGDALNLTASFAEEANFDAVTMAFAIRNIPDRLRVLQEIFKVLKHGGKVAILELGEPTFAPARWFVRYCVPFIGSLLSGGARREYEHLEKSVMAFDSKRFAQQISDAGFQLQSITAMNFGSVNLFVATKAEAP